MYEYVCVGTSDSMLSYCTYSVGRVSKVIHIRALVNGYCLLFFRLAKISKLVTCNICDPCTFSPCHFQTCSIPYASRSLELNPRTNSSQDVVDNTDFELVLLLACLWCRCCGCFCCHLNEPQTQLTNLPLLDGLSYPATCIRPLDD